MNTLSIIKILLWLLGEAIIIAGFYLLAGEHSAALWFKLDIIVASLVYTFNAFNLNRVTYSPQSFDKKLAGIGIGWFATGFYSILAIVGIAVGLIWALPENIQLIYQAIFLLMYLWGVSSSMFSSHFSNQIDKNKEDWTARQYNLITGFQEIESILIRRNELRNQLAAIDDLEHKAKNISCSTLPRALELETEIRKEINLLLRICKSGTPNEEEIKQHFGACNILLDERKKLSYK